MISLAGMRSIPQWFVWRLEWSAEKSKYLKTPCAHDGSVYRIDAADPANWSSYEVVERVVRELPAAGELRYAMGFWLTAECGYWFLDIDKCSEGDGTATPYAMQLVNAFAGCFVEWSSSQRGLHVIGRGQVPANHRNKPERAVAEQIAPVELEFYNEGRGIAFGLSGESQGSADVVCDVGPLCAMYFPPRPEREAGVRPEWRGPSDDAVLLARALNAKPSAEVAFGGKASFAQLWRGEVAKESEADMALAAHLAFWTGCDEQRIERMMLTSGLVRDKWHSKRGELTYLQLTIANACAGCSSVYQEAQRDMGALTAMLSTVTAAPAVEGELVPKEMFDTAKQLLDAVTSAGSDEEMINRVVPRVHAAQLAPMFHDTLAQAMKRQMASWGSVISVGKARALLFPPAKAGTGPGMPDWAKPYVYVPNGDYFFNTNNGQRKSFLGFQAVYGRLMPLNEQGKRENAAERALHFWNMQTVEQVGYRPDHPPVFEWGGVTYANLYSPMSLPACEPLSARGVEAIEHFKGLLWDLCGRRQAVYDCLFWWFVHNIQRPGHKIMWAPIIKGSAGDGKSLAFAVLRAVMGTRNVVETGNATLRASGGFNDWAVRGAVNVIEEIMLTGHKRHEIYNVMKTFITNKTCNINPKGAISYDTFNITNHAATTNHNDALPLERDDRRWFVVFTPWANKQGMESYTGLGADGWRRRVDALDYACDHLAGELRTWFLSLEIPPTFDTRGAALMTPEKLRMMASSKDEAEGAIQGILAEGGVGVTSKVFSSSMLTKLLSLRASQDKFELPKSNTLNHALNRLGYSKMDSYVKWANGTHTIWLENGTDLSNDEIRAVLDSTRVGDSIPCPTSNNLPKS